MGRFARRFDTNGRFKDVKNRLRPLLLEFINIFGLGGFLKSGILKTNQNYRIPRILGNLDLILCYIYLSDIFGAFCGKYTMREQWLN